MSRPLVGLVLLCTLAWSAAGGIGLPPENATQGKPEKSGKTEASAPGAVALAEDKGKFRLLLDGQPVGSEEFEISRNGQEWTARGTTEIRVFSASGSSAARSPAGGTMQVRGQLRLAADGTPLRYEWSAEGQKKASATVEFQRGTAKMVLQLEGTQPFMQELTFGSPRVLILDNNLYHHYAVLARLYDWNTKGTQTFPVLIPQEMTPGTLTVESAGLQNVDGASLETLRVRTADLEIYLYLDASHRLVRLAVPASKALVLRE